MLVGCDVALLVRRSCPSRTDAAQAAQLRSLAALDLADGSYRPPRSAAAATGLGVPVTRRLIDPAAAGRWARADGRVVLGERALLLGKSA